MTHVDRGLKGLNQGLPNGQVNINRYINGTHRARYYLLGADSNVGKTTLGDYMYFYHLHEAAERRGVNLELDYYSFEVSEIMKKARLASLIYNLEYKENLPSALILGQDDREPPKRLSNQQYAQVKLVATKVERIFSHINFIETPATPFDMWKQLVRRAEKSGKLLRNKDNQGRVSEIVGYVPEKDVMRFTIVDHIALLENERGMTAKQSIDTASTYFVRARNLFNDSFLIIQQFNSEMQSVARDKKSPMAYVPVRKDFGDSSYTFRDADIVMGLTRPADFQLNEFGDFTELHRWGQYFVVNFLMKNRYGPRGMGVPMFMNPIAGIPEELPAKGWNSLLQDIYIKKAEELDKNADYTS